MSQILTKVDILAVVSAKSGVAAEDLLGPSRLREFVRPRQIAFALMIEEFGYGRADVGRFFHRDHTTIIDGLLATETRHNAEDRELRAVCAETLARLGLLRANEMSDRLEAVKATIAEITEIEAETFRSQPVQVAV